MLKHKRGFTLIELLIVIVVIAILALIVIPKLMGASRKAKESTLRSNLQLLRNSIELFHADTGVYPATLHDLTVTSAPGTGADGATIPTGTYKGPYLSTQGGIFGLPINPFQTATVGNYGAAESAVTAKPTGTTSEATAHWKYYASTGTVYSGIAGSTVDTPSVNYFDL